MQRRNYTISAKEQKQGLKSDQRGDEDTQSFVIGLELELLRKDYFQPIEREDSVFGQGSEANIYKDDSPQANDSPSIELVTPSIEEPLPPHLNPYSTTSTNTDICVLDESLYAHTIYGEDDDEGDGDSQCQQLRMERSIDAPDFTVLHAPPSSSPPHRRRIPSHVCDESTEVLLLDNSEFNGRTTCSGTDSDVEVLMSEEIIDSDWSAGGGLVRLEQGAAQMSAVRTSKPSAAASADCVRHQESTDQDISVEEFSHNSSGAGYEIDGSAYEQLNRSQLLAVIREQTERIRCMEERLENYRAAQQTLFEHVDALRLQFATNTIN